jgi:hypothetical protein
MPRCFRSRCCGGKIEALNEARCVAHVIVDSNVRASHFGSYHKSPEFIQIVKNSARRKRARPSQDDDPVKKSMGPEPT